MDTTSTCSRSAQNLSRRCDSLMLESTQQTIWQTMFNFLNLSFWVDPILILLTISRFLGHFSMVLFYVFIPSQIMSNGMSLKHASFVLTATGISNSISRVLVGGLMDHPKVNATTLTAIAFFFQSATLFYFPFCKHYTLMLVLGGVIGVINAPYNISLSIMLGELLPLEMISSSFGKIAMAQGLGAIAGPTVAGFIYDYTGNLTVVLYMAAIGYLVGGVTCGFAAYLHYKKKILVPNELS